MTPLFLNCISILCGRFKMQVGNRTGPKTALVHRLSASRSRTMKRFLPLPVSFRTSAHSVFYSNERR